MLNTGQGLGLDSEVKLEMNEVSHADIDDVALFPIDCVTSRFF